MRRFLTYAFGAAVLVCLAGCSGTPGAPVTQNAAAPTAATSSDLPTISGGTQDPPGVPGQPKVDAYLNGVATLSWKQPTEGGRADFCDVYYQPVPGSQVPNDQNWTEVASAVGDPTKEWLSVQFNVADPGRYAFAVSCRNNAGASQISVQPYAELQ